MSLKVGIVGLPNVGKSTLFNALLKKRVALSANYPFATIEPNTGVVAVPDLRLQKLAELVKAEEKMDHLPPLVPAVVEFVDIAGLVKGASTGAGLGNKFLSHIREVDAIIHVLRDFTDTNIVREGSENPESDRTTIETELILADLETIEKLIFAQDKEAKTGKDPVNYKKLEILKRVQGDLNQGKALSKFYLGDDKLQDWFEHLPILTIKPVLYVFNVAEKEYAKRLENVIPDFSVIANPEGVWQSSTLDINPSSEDLHVTFAPQDDKNNDINTENSMVISARLEEELVELSEEERKDYLKELGIEETGLERLIKKAYTLLDLASYLTAGKKEVRAWTVKKNSKAPQAAGVIHTDFEKNFIRAEVIEFEKLIEAGSMADAKKLGWVRTEGKEYVVKDGDVVEFLIGS